MCHKCELNWSLSSGAFWYQCNSNKLSRLRIPTGRRQTSWLWTSEAKELNQGLTWRNPTVIGQSRTWTQRGQTKILIPFHFQFTIHSPFHFHLWDYRLKEMLYEVRYLKSSEDMMLHLLDNLSNCLMNLKNSGESTGFKPMTSAMLVQSSNQLSYKVTKLRAGQFVGLMFSRERNVVWKKEVMGAISVESSEFFRFMRQFLKLSSKCEDHIFTGL